MAKKKLTEQDFKNNPDLFNKHHFVIGDEVDLDALKQGDEKIKIGNANEPQNDDDTGGSNPPPNKGRG
jgi:hypothetical protein